MLLFLLPTRARGADIAPNIHVDDRLIDAFLPKTFTGLFLLLVAPPLIPYCIAHGLDNYGFTRFPYQEGPKVYGNGERARAFTASVSRQFGRRGRGATHASARYRNEERLGLDLAASNYDGGTFGNDKRAGHYALHATANYLQADRALLEFGMGAAVIQDPGASWGPSGNLGLELFPLKPLTASILYQADLLDGIGHHSLSGGAGFSWRGFGVTAGYRALLRPGRDAYGPELSLRVWF